MTARETSHELYEQLAVGHALSALEPEDELVFLGHLPGCAACAGALGEHFDTLAHLAYGVASEAPPLSVLEGIRAGVAESGRSGSFPAPAPMSLDEARSRRQTRTVRWSTAVVGAAASVVMVVALVLANENLKSHNRDVTTNAAKLQQTVASLLVDGSRKIDLTGASGQKGVVVVNGDSVSLVMQGLPVNDHNSIYVLWERSRYGDVRPVGSFDVLSTGLTLVNNLHVADKAGIKTFMVTHEAGRKAPSLSTQPAVVTGEA